MIVAKNNIIVRINGKEKIEYAILNPIAGNFDIMDEEEHKQYLELEKGKQTDEELESYLMERGYAFCDDNTYQKALKSAYDEFQKEVKDAQVQLMIIPTYSCNLACTYCFQHGIDGRPTLMTKEIVDAFFDYANQEFKDRAVKPFITLFGGEPLIDSVNHREIIEYIVERCIKDDYELSAVTNGYDFASYADLLSRAKIKEIQFTLDGTAKIHDKRRLTANGKGSFDRVIDGMEKAVSYGMPINLRTVTDRENIDDLVPLAELLDKKGWLDLPLELFKTQIGRNYELFECYEKPQHLFSQVEMWAHVAKLAKQYPVMKKFHKPDFMGLRYLVETGEMYLASFDTCPAAKTEWVFDLYGDIYGCTASCGREDFKLGTFWPIVAKNQESIEQWSNRDVTKIEKCKSCKYDVVCGGGCGVIAANRNDGVVWSPDCRPIQELYDIGIDYYQKEIQSLVQDPDEAQTQKTITIKEGTHSKGIDENVSHGCMICGGKMIYGTHPRKLKCDICGEEFVSNMECEQGHYVCDACHKGDVLDHMELLLVKSTEVNPIRLAKKIFDMPTMKMHGPEHHSMVPAVLETASQNISGNRDLTRIKEAIRRGIDIKGGSCGYHGNCGACVGVGIAESLYVDADVAVVGDNVSVE